MVRTHFRCSCLTSPTALQIPRILLVSSACILSLVEISYAKNRSFARVTRCHLPLMRPFPRPHCLAHLSAALFPASVFISDWLTNPAFAWTELTFELCLNQDLEGKVRPEVTRSLIKPHQNAFFLVR